MKKPVLCLSFIAALLLGSMNASACTDFRVQAKDGSVLITRSMEFGVDMKSNLRTSPRGRSFNLVTGEGKPALSWKAKYGYLYLDGLNVDNTVDGMNEAGLSYEALFFPGYAQYQTAPAGQDSQILPYMNIGDWILGNFKTIDEVRAALPNIYVVTEKLPGLGDMVFPLHFSIYDASGKGIVVEYTEGKMKVYDSIGIMTNSPGYKWHMENLQNYLHLAPSNPSTVLVSGVPFAANGQGFGMIGLPGDISPPSRFVKTATLANVALPVDTALDAVNLAEHIINNVDIPLGLAREPVNGQPTAETTEWVVFKDLTNKVFYYRTYNNMTLRSIPLSKMHFEPNAPRLKMPIADKENVQDISEQFLQAKATS